MLSNLLRSQGEGTSNHLRLQAICATFHGCVKARTVAKVDEALSALKDCPVWGERAYNKICQLPLYVQFPAYAIHFGYPASRGNDTGNDAEVEWTMAKAIRNKENFLDQMVAGVAMCKYQQKRSVALLKKVKCEWERTPGVSKAVPPNITALHERRLQLRSKWVVKWDDLETLTATVSKVRLRTLLRL